MQKESFMMHMMQYKLVISESTIVAACHITRFYEMLNVDQTVRWLCDRVSFIYKV